MAAPAPVPGFDPLFQFKAIGSPPPLRINVESEDKTKSFEDEDAAVESSAAARAEIGARATTPLKPQRPELRHTKQLKRRASVLSPTPETGSTNTEKAGAVAKETTAAPKRNPAKAAAAASEKDADADAATKEDVDAFSKTEAEGSSAGNNRKQKIRKLESTLTAAIDVYTSVLQAEENKKNYEEALTKHENAKAILAKVSAINKENLDAKQKKLLRQFEKTFADAAEAPDEPAMVDDASVKEMDDKLFGIVRESLIRKRYADCVKALTAAIKGMRISLIEEIFKAGLRLTEDDAETFNCLLAAANSTPQIALMILAHNPRLVFSKFRTNNLHYRFYRLVIRNAATDLCRALIARNVDCTTYIRLKDGTQSDPIYLQVAAMTVEIAQLIIENQAILNTYGLSMINKALNEGKIDIADAIRVKLNNFNFAGNERITEWFVEAIDNGHRNKIEFFMRCQAQNAETLSAAIRMIGDEDDNNDAIDRVAQTMIQRGILPSDALWHYVRQHPCLDIDKEAEEFELEFVPDVQVAIDNFLRLGADINMLVEGRTILSFLLERAFDSNVNNYQSSLAAWRIAILEAIKWFIRKGADLALKEDGARSAFEIAVRLANVKSVVSAMLPSLVDPIENNQEALTDGLVQLIVHATQVTLRRASYVDAAKYLIVKKKASPQAALNDLSARYSFGYGSCEVRPVGVKFLFENGAKAFFNEDDERFPPVFESFLNGQFLNYTVLEDLSKAEDRNYLCKDLKSLGLLSYSALSVLNFQGIQLTSRLEIFTSIAAEIAKHPRAKFNYKDVLCAYILLKSKGINVDDFPVFKGLLPWVHGALNYNLLNDAYVAVKSLTGEYLARTDLPDSDKIVFEDQLQDTFSSICTEFESSLFRVRADHYLNQTQSSLLTGLTEAQVKAVEAVNYETEIVALFNHVRSALPTPDFDRITRDYFYLFDQLPEEQKKYYNSKGVGEGCWHYYSEQNLTNQQARVQECIMQIAPAVLSNIMTKNYEERVRALFDKTAAFFPIGLQTELHKGIRFYVLTKFKEEVKALVTPFLTTAQLTGKTHREMLGHLFGLAHAFPFKKAIEDLLLNIRNRVNYTGVRGFPKEYDATQIREAEKWERDTRMQYPGATYLPFLQKSIAETNNEGQKKFFNCQIQKEKFYLKLEQYLRVLVFAIHTMRAPAVAAAVSSSSALSPLAKDSAVNLFFQIREFMGVCASGWTDILERMAEVFLKDLKRQNLMTTSQNAAKASAESQEKGAKEREEKHFKELSNSEAEKQLSLRLGSERRDIIGIWAKLWRDQKNKSRQEHFRKNIEELKRVLADLRQLGRPPAEINAAIANVAAAEANAAAEAKLAHGSEVHYAFKALEVHGARLGIPNSEGVVEDVERWTDEMDKQFQEFFDKKYLSVSNRIDQITKWINSSRDLMDLFEADFKKHFLDDWRSNYYQEIENDIKKVVDAVLVLMQENYASLIKEQQSKEELVQLENLVVKAIHEATVNDSGIVIKIESIRSQVLLKRDPNLLKADLHRIISQTVLAAKKVAFITEGRVLSADDGLVHRWMVRDYLLKVKVLGLPEVSAPAAASSSASAAAAGAGMGAGGQRVSIERPIPQRPLPGQPLRGGLIEVRGMPPPGQPQPALGQHNQQRGAAAAQAFPMAGGGLPPVPPLNPLLPLPGAFVPPLNFGFLPDAPPDAVPLAADPNAVLPPHLQNALRRQF
jgi:hypothetical protein